MANKKISQIATATVATDSLLEIETAAGVSGSCTVASLLALAASGTPTWLTYAADFPPVSPNAMDDEFNSYITLPGHSGAKWTWVNQGAATCSIVNGVLQMVAPAASGINFRLLTQATPSLPYEFTCKVALSNLPAATFPKTGLAIRESSTGKITHLCVHYDATVSGVNKVSVIDWTNPTTYSATAFDGAFTPAAGVVYLRIVDNGVQHIFSISTDGITFYNILSRTRTSFLTVAGGNQIGLIVGSENATYPVAGSYSWFRRTDQQLTPLTLNFHPADTLWDVSSLEVALTPPPLYTGTISLTGTKDWNGTTLGGSSASYVAGVRTSGSGNLVITTSTVISQKSSTLGDTGTVSVTVSLTNGGATTGNFVWPVKLAVITGIMTAPGTQVGNNRVMTITLP